MSSSDNKRVHGVSYLTLAHSNESVNTRAHEKPSFGGGNDGGDGMDDLKKRVERTEENIAQIKADLATLITRSENLASKSTLDALVSRSENFASKSTLDALVSRSETFATKSDVESVRTEIYKAQSQLSIDFTREIRSVSRSIWIPLTVGIVGGLLLWAVKMFFTQ